MDHARFNCSSAAATFVSTGHPKYPDLQEPIFDNDRALSVFPRCVEEDQAQDKSQAVACEAVPLPVRDEEYYLQEQEKL